MGIYKRGGTWWYEFVFNGSRIRESAKTGSKTSAREAERARRRELELGINGIRKRNFPLFSKAGKGWLDTKTGLTEPSRNHYQQYIDRLSERFGGRLVCDISVEDVVALQIARRKAGLSGRTINAELGVLRQILKRHRLWAPIASDIHFDRENRDVGKALGSEDEARLLKAAGESRSPALLPLFVLSIDTGLRPSEIRRVRHGDLNLVWKNGVIASGEVVVGRSKTEGGTGRVVPLTSRAQSLSLR